MEIATAYFPTMHGAYVPASPPAPLRDTSRSLPSCGSCTQVECCGSLALDAGDAGLVDRVAVARMRVRKGATLFRAGDRFAALYAIRCGSFKTQVVTDEGHAQVSGYHIAGDIIGSDGIGDDVHDCEAVALEDAEVCALPFERVETLAREDVAFQRSLHRMLAGEIVRERGVMVMLGTMRAEQRLASFLLDLARRYQARGYSAHEFVLRMTREDIGSYLGLTLETVSRLFSRFRDSGWIEVRGRTVKLLDRPALQRTMLAA